MPRPDFCWACPSGITTGQLQQAHRLVSLSIGLVPMEATTGQLFRRNSPSNPTVLSKHPDIINETVRRLHSLHFGQIVEERD